MNTNLQLTVERLNTLTVRDIVSDELVKANFIRVYDTLWGEGLGAAAYERECAFFTRIVDTTPNLRECTPFSAFSAFIDVAISGLSLEPGAQALAYLQPKKVKVGEALNSTGQKKAQYEPRVVLLITGYGELVMRKRSGQIRHADNPVLVYDGDEFSFSDHGGRKEVDYTCRLPHTNQRIVACFLRITRADGTIDYSVMFEEDWERLKTYSAKNNRRYNTSTQQMETGDPNALYTSNNGQIDTGFLKAKCIKHAFQSYPKVRVGKATELETQQEDLDTLYDASEPAPQAADTGYAESPKAMSEGVTVPTKDDDVF